MPSKKKTVKELNLEVEMLTERVRKLEEKDATEKESDSSVKLNGIEEMLKTYDKKIDALDKALNQAKHNTLIERNAEEKKKMSCRVCKREFEDKITLKEHIKQQHPRE